MKKEQYMTTRELAASIVKADSVINDVIEAAIDAIKVNAKDPRIFLEDVYFFGMLAGSRNHEQVQKMISRAFFVVPTTKGDPN